jgi:hypothetical protein
VGGRVRQALRRRDLRQFCANATPPTIASLLDLETLLGCAYPNPNNDPNVNATVRMTFNAESEGLQAAQSRRSRRVRS